MAVRRSVLQAAALALCLLGGAAAAQAQSRAIDAGHSFFTVRVFKSGLFSAFAHNHEIRAPIAQGTLHESEPQSVELLVDARHLQVLDPGLAADQRVEVQQTMLGPKVLDSERFPEIRFRSNGVQKDGDGRWQVGGELTLHGQTRSLVVPVRLEEGRYRGAVTLRQTDFGISPVTVAGGTVKVKNEIRVEFEIAVR